MSQEYTFVKLYHGGAQGDREAERALRWLDERCDQNGLRPVDHEEDSHFTFLLIASPTRWLHFSCLGHYLPADSHAYETVFSQLSREWPLVSLEANYEHTYALRRYDEAQIVGLYANLTEDGPFPTPQSAQIWQPVFDDWRDLLAEGITEKDFYELLPAPATTENPSVADDFDHYDLPEHLAHLFGWNKRLNLSSVGLREDGVVTRGDDFRPETGDYHDEEYDLDVYVRCYAHPEPHSNYAITYDG